MYTHIEPKKVHQGRNIKRLREMLGVKQDTLATELNITQATMSKLEAKEEIDKNTLEKVAQILKIPVEAIENFNDEGALNFIANTANSYDSSVSHQFYFNFNPIDKIVELYSEKEALYERMIQEKNELIEKLLSK
ncbi:XRE family transcriptional regulator [Apibacter muscae]|uniref:helix-turn-helix domain-containing protein n=1 Tax=Apibacter muscae TaxID=2509004 RepID=UPI0011AD56BF|nr:helix-turn-helix transcriptional regulator [Apibacter muscae]TWP28278.1 XRE family transcriptional regulator [Apibacter muscae]